MEKITDYLERTLVPWSEKISGNTFLRAIMDGFTKLLPIIMIGALFTLLSSLQIGFYQNFITWAHLKPIFAYAPVVTTGCLALYAVLLIAKSLAEHIGIEEHSTLVGTIGLMAFLILLPDGFTPKGGAKISGVLDMTYLGAPGLFMAIILGLLVPLMFSFLVRHKVVLRMPESVPPGIANAFLSLVPAMIIALVMGTVKFLFALTAFGNPNTFIYMVLQKPLTSLGANPFTFVVLEIVCSLMWFFGVHGGLVVMSLLTILYQPASLENLAAYGAGAELTHMITKSSWYVFSSMGGAGGTLGLCILMAFVARSQRYKTLGRLALPAGVCGINEPITFGTPIVLNPIMLVPFVITPVTTFLLSYGATVLRIIPPLNGVEIPTGTPVLLSGWLTGGWKVLLFQVGITFLQILMYFPFFTVMDRRAVADEHALELADLDRQAVVGEVA